MPDAVRMIDLAALPRGLDEARRSDPEHRLFAERVATAAAVKHVEELHRDVQPSLESNAIRVDAHGEGGRRHGHKRHPEEASSEKEAAHCPEQEEGRLLDIKV